MKQLLFEATLLSDVVLSETSATAGGHTTLSFLPGATFLGACASRMYPSFGDNREAAGYDVFYSGKVRFGDAYPVAPDGSPTFPVPLSWVRPKEEGAGIDGMVNPNVLNLLRIDRTRPQGERAEGTRPKQMREGFFSATGRYVDPSRGFRLKTAVDRATGGRPDEGRLFGYEHLEAGSRWWFAVKFDDAVSPGIVAKVEESLTAAPLRIGRSRSAEYGAVSVRKVPGDLPDPAAAGGSAEIALYCLSDLALRNPETGSPILYPEWTLLGIGGDLKARFRFERSFLRTRSYAPYNAKRRAADIERHVISRGSVLVYEAERPLSVPEAEAFRTRLSNGVGMYQQDGLGRLWLDPWFLAGEKVTFAAGDDPSANKFGTKPGGRKEAQSESELLSWLEEKAAEREIDRAAETLAERWITVLVPAVKAAGSKGPGKSQWSQLRHVGAGSADPGKLEESFRRLTGHGVSRKRWTEQEFRVGDEWVSFAEYLRREVLAAVEKDRGKIPLYRKALFKLGTRMPHEMNREGVDR